MYKIMLCCSAGMSTSMLVRKMEQAAEANNISATIEAHGADLFDQKQGEYDVILLGPQVGYMKESLAARAEGKPVEVINPMDYGMQNGEKVLNWAISLI
uniref:PTS sugar transporter subunit IIB n=1 Tax=Thaumasiovibrio occultus TaxID=1891184 RepID=UPI000B35D6D3|nr:PTS sugar transporter subunit IIB [Thaumasiovibrio occultus]